MTNDPRSHGPSPFPGLTDDDGTPPGVLILRTPSDPAIVLIRIAVGWIFAWSGILKFVDPGRYGAGAFDAWGFMFPDLLGPLVGAFEIICGLLVLVGLGVRVAVVPLLAIILTALLRVRLPLVGAEGPLAAVQASHLELVLLLAGIFLLVKGAGPFSLDHRVASGAEGAPRD